MGRRKGPRIRKPTAETRRRILESKEYTYFTPAHHALHLGLDAKFVTLLTPKTRILEIGSGSDRLADYLLRASKMRPENYDLMDIAYGEHPPVMKGGIYRLARKGKIRLVHGDIFSEHLRLPQKKYDHILVSEAFLPHLQKWYRYSDQYAGFNVLKKIVDRLKVSLKSGGSIRISDVSAVTIKQVIDNAENAFPEFRVRSAGSATGGSLILFPTGAFPEHRVSGTERGIILEKI